MGRYSGNNSKHFWCKADRHPDDYTIGWTVDYYYQSSRLRWPRSFRRTTDAAGARRFCRKHKLLLPERLS